MAIQKLVNSEYLGTEFPEAYWKIHNVRIDVEKSEMWIELRAYANADARAKDTDGRTIGGIEKRTEKVPLSEVIPKEYTADGIKAAAYEYIKTLKEYQGGVDV